MAWIKMTVTEMVSRGLILAICTLRGESTALTDEVGIECKTKEK